MTDRVAPFGTAVGDIVAVVRLCNRVFDAFKHQPLLEPDHIRLVQVLSGVQSADVPCSVVLNHVPLESNIEYTALSYTWGSPEQPSRTISCNGAPLKVRDNLYQALVHLSKRPTQYYWIDALCINQTDTEERGRQVQLMGAIYSRAQTVLAWLGNENLPPDPLNRKHHPQELLSSTYFNRLWTIQETMLSKRVVYIWGDTEMGWSAVHDHLLREGGVSTPLPQNQQALRFFSIVSSVPALGRLLKDPVKTTSLPLRAWKEFQQLTTFAKSLQTTDPRDRVFSWYGIASALGIKLPAPDYTKPIAVVVQEAKQALSESLPGLRREDSVAQTYSPTGDAAIPIRSKAGALATPSTLCHTRSLLSSGSEADDQSNVEESSDSEDDAGLENLWHTATKYLLDQNKVLLLKAILTDLNIGREEGALFVCNGHGKDTSQDSTRQSKGNQSQSKKKQRTNAGESQGMWDQKENRDDDHDSDDDDIHGRPRKLVKKLAQGNPQNRFACPYFQRNSQSSQLNSSCHGPGFPTIHRLKEHLDRVHYIHQCDRCGDIFDAQPLLAAHRLVPASEICDVTNWASMFDRNRGFADTQKGSIKHIKPNRSGNPWHEIFGVLFPEDAEGTYPPPYHNNTQFIQFLHRLQSHWTQQAPTVLSRRMADASIFSHLASQDPQAARAEWIQLVNQVGLEIFRSFQHKILQGNQNHEGDPLVPAGSRTLPELPLPAGATQESATNEAQAGPAMDASALAYDYSSPGANPPDPSQALLDFFNNLTPTLGEDTTWALDCSLEDTTAGPSTGDVPRQMQDVSTVNPLRLATGLQREEDTFYEGTDGNEQAVERDWDLV